MSSGMTAVVYDRVSERRRAVALARHFREAEGLSIAQVADRLGRSPATVKAYFYDPTREKARGGQGAIPGGVPGLRRLHAAAQQQRRRLPVLQAVPALAPATPPRWPSVAGAAR